MLVSKKLDGVLSAAHTQAGYCTSLWWLSERGIMFGGGHTTRRYVASPCYRSSTRGPHVRITHVYVMFRSKVMEHTASLAESQPAVKCVTTPSTTWSRERWSPPMYRHCWNQIRCAVTMASAQMAWPCCREPTDVASCGISRTPIR